MIPCKHVVASARDDVTSLARSCRRTGAPGSLPSLAADALTASQTTLGPRLHTGRLTWMQPRKILLLKETNLVKKNQLRVNLLILEQHE